MSWNDENKIWRCETCLKYVKAKDMLTAPSPFDPDATLTGCPHCKATTGDSDGWEEKCEKEDCNSPATCGTPIKGGGYLRCCGKHYRETKE